MSSNSTTQRLKHLVTNVVEQITGGSDRSDYVGLEAIESWSGRIRATQTGGKSGNKFKPGDVLFGKLRPYLAKVAAPKFSGYCSTDALVLRPSTRITTSFLLYLLIQPQTISRVSAATYGVKMPRVSWGYIQSLEFSIPCVIQQKLITTFLDHETSRIDQLVEKKQRLIELLDEKRHALITAAVTGQIGLTGNSLAVHADCETKKPIKHLFSVSRLMVNPQSFGEALVFHYSLPEWHETGNGRLQSVKEIQSGKIFIEGGEVLVSKLNPEKGVVIHSKKHDVPILCSSEFIVLKAIEGSMHSRFSYYLMSSSPIRALLEASVESVTNSHKRARVDQFLKHRVDVLDFEDQKYIADFLDVRTSQIDILTQKSRSSIKLLREFRSSLIAAAVTGQIDVNKWSNTGETDRRLDHIEENSEL
ncbi:MAG: hypothetical protein F4039_05510 [Gammaproteobacteria bacterium]|nr:hypothetical protein [Gammaproteobacteria bacterium]MYF52705.1 hypothetical protein [Gammaproteobacteria bacterium]MYK43524.1 hypothetical protein [Gammaproteobacteria bacterium]